MKYLLIALLLLPSTALAQQQPSPAQTALQINSVIGQWAQTIEAQQQTIAQLQQALQQSQAKVADLEKQLAAAKTPEPK